MNLLIIYLALILAVVAADQDIGPIDPWVRRKLMKKGMLCIDFGVIEVTVVVDGDNNDGRFKYFKHQGAQKGPCKDPPGQIPRVGDKDYCRKLNKEFYELRAPGYADNWLKKRKWKSGTCKSNDIDKDHDITMDQVFVTPADKDIRVNKCTCPCNCNSDDVAIVKARNKCRCKCDCDESGAQPWHKNNKLRNNIRRKRPNRTKQALRRKKKRDFDRINKLQREQIRRKFNRRHPG